jgi:hypothetical protein
MPSRLTTQPTTHHTLSMTTTPPIPDAGPNVPNPSHHHHEAGGSGGTHAITGLTRLGLSRGLSGQSASFFGVA